jgi:hypothetical protein
VLLSFQSYQKIVDICRNSDYLQCLNDPGTVYLGLRAAQFHRDTALSITLIKNCKLVSNCAYSSQIAIRGIALSKSLKNQDSLKSHCLDYIYSNSLSTKSALDIYNNSKSKYNEIFDSLPSMKSHYPERVNASNKIRIALCISGQARGFEGAFRKIKDNLIDKLYPDVFLAVWDAVGMKVSINNKEGLRRVVNSRLASLIPQDMLDEGLFNFFPSIEEAIKPWNSESGKNEKLFSRLEQLYKPVSAEMYSELEYSETLVGENFQKQTQKNQSKMKFMIFKANALKRNVENQLNFKYDLVIRLRFDKAINKSINLDNSFFESLSNSIYVDHLSHHGSGDQIAYGSSELMDFYSAMGPVMNEMTFGEIKKPMSGLAGHTVIKDMVFNSPLNLTRSTPFVGGELENLQLTIQELAENGFLADLALQKERLDNKTYTSILSLFEHDDL